RASSCRAASGAIVELVFLSIAWLAVVVWLILRAFNQRNTVPILAVAQAMPGEAPFVTVVIPARDEAANIGRCLAGVLTQTYPESRLDVIVVDDQSADDTFAIAAAIAAPDRR